jgi:hypothetical protein
VEPVAVVMVATTHLLFFLFLAKQTPAVVAVVGQVVAQP